MRVRVLCYLDTRYMPRLLPDVGAITASLSDASNQAIKHNIIIRIPVPGLLDALSTFSNQVR